MDTVMSKARELGVGHMLCVSIDLESFPEVLALAKQYPHVQASVGVHPNTDAGQEPAVEQLVALASDDRVVAIGETGLDYYRSRGDLEWQRQRFRAHIRAARQTGKPLIVHSREAGTDVIRLLKEEGAGAIGGVMHCFVGDWETAQEAMALNFYISFSGIVTFRNAGGLRDVAKRIPVDRLLVETDAPYLAPVPFRGKVNQPAYVHYVAQCLSELREVAFEDLAAQTTENFFSLFSNAEKI